MFTNDHLITMHDYAKLSMTWAPNSSAPSLLIVLVVSSASQNVSLFMSQIVRHYFLTHVLSFLSSTVSPVFAWIISTHSSSSLRTLSKNCKCFFSVHLCIMEHWWEKLLYRKRGKHEQKISMTMNMFCAIN